MRVAIFTIAFTITFSIWGNSQYGWDLLLILPVVFNGCMLLAALAEKRNE